MFCWVSVFPNSRSGKFPLHGSAMMTISDSMGCCAMNCTHNTTSKVYCTWLCLMQFIPNPCYYTNHTCVIVSTPYYFIISRSKYMYVHWNLSFMASLCALTQWSKRAMQWSKPACRLLLVLLCLQNFASGFNGMGGQANFAIPVSYVQSSLQIQYM